MKIIYRFFVILFFACSTSHAAHKDSTPWWRNNQRGIRYDESATRYPITVLQDNLVDNVTQQPYALGFVTINGENYAMRFELGSRAFLCNQQGLRLGIHEKPAILVSLAQSSDQHPPQHSAPASNVLPPKNNPAIRGMSDVREHQNATHNDNNNHEDNNSEKNQDTPLVNNEQVLATTNYAAYCKTFLAIVGISTCTSIAAALVVDWYNKQVIQQNHTKIDRIRAAAITWIATAMIVGTGFYFLSSDTSLNNETTA